MNWIRISIFGGKSLNVQIYLNNEYSFVHWHWYIRNIFFSNCFPRFLTDKSENSSFSQRYFPSVNNAKSTSIFQSSHKYYLIWFLRICKHRFFIENCAPLISSISDSKTNPPLSKTRTIGTVLHKAQNHFLLNLHVRIKLCRHCSKNWTAVQTGGSRLRQLTFSNR